MQFDPRLIERIKQEVRQEFEERDLDRQKELKNHEETLIRQRIEWEFVLEVIKIQGRGALEFAQIAIKSLTLVNGASVISLLTFIGNKSSSLTTLQLEFLARGLWAFSAGVALGLVTTLLAYITQLELSTNYPGLGEKEPILVKVLRSTAIFVGVSSLISFVVGVIFSGFAFT